MPKTVLGLFSDRVDAEEAIASLEEYGFTPKDISIVMKDRGEAEAVSDSTGASVAEGAVTGATTGAAVGGLAGLLLGIGAIAIPGIGGLLIGGPLAAALGLTGAAASTITGAATGALAGGLLGALMGLGIPEDEARVYEERIREGGILVAVPAASDSYADVKDILEDNGADQVRAISYPREAIDADADYETTTPSYRSSFDPSYQHMGAKGGRKRLRRIRN